ncbi:hypothetical protein BDY19DRAFT_907764 [Irpex rosettiformis]|uniref:Uncharacterized protein n=1 Tax=Irpex rosettiformis TaxID=378272 RepID=A0ACB8TYS8_9APHY|nr:hypothetical protein BDY19DRAFT_907764 [Irpex rosettiformis]
MHPGGDDSVTMLPMEKSSTLPCTTKITSKNRNMQTMLKSMHPQKTVSAFHSGGSNSTTGTPSTVLTASRSFNRLEEMLGARWHGTEYPRHYPLKQQNPFDFCLKAVHHRLNPAQEGDNLNLQTLSISPVVLRRAFIKRQAQSVADKPGCLGTQDGLKFNVSTTITADTQVRCTTELCAFPIPSRSEQAIIIEQPFAWQIQGLKIFSMIPCSVSPSYKTPRPLGSARMGVLALRSLCEHYVYHIRMKSSVRNEVGVDHKHFRLLVLHALPQSPKKQPELHQRNVTPRGKPAVQPPSPSSIVPKSYTRKVFRLLFSNVGRGPGSVLKRKHDGTLLYDVNWHLPVQSGAGG